MTMPHAPAEAAQRLPPRRWTARQRRLLLIVATLLLASTALALALRAFQSNLVYFLSPTQVAAGEAAGRQGVRVGGLVRAGSIERLAGAGHALEVRFVLTDHAHDVPVRYQGVLPDLFLEGKGAIAQGTLDADGHLQATTVLAKHDENYVAPEVGEALKKGRAMQAERAEHVRMPPNAAQSADKHND